MRNYTLINPNGGGMGYTNLGDAAVANLAALGGQVTVLGTARSLDAKENATVSHTEGQGDMDAHVCNDARTEDNGTLITTLEGVRTSGAVSFAGQGISSTISTCDVKNVLEMIAGNHTISGSVIRTDQGTVSDVDSSVTASQGTTVSIRNTVISNITKNIKRALSVNGSSTVSTLSSAISNDVLGQAAVSIGNPGDETDNSQFLASVLEGKSAKDASFAFVNEGASFEGNTLNLSCAEQVLDGGGHNIVGSNIFNRTNLQSVPASTSTIQANAYFAK
jgi:predicted nucleotidyltransferase